MLSLLGAFIFGKETDCHPHQENNQSEAHKTNRKLCCPIQVACHRCACESRRELRNPPIPQTSES